MEHWFDDYDPHTYDEEFDDEIGNEPYERLWALDLTEPSPAPTKNLSAQNITLSPEDRIDFISRLCKDEQGAIEVVAEYLAEVRRPVKTEEEHTFWTGQFDGQFYRYVMNHGLGTTKIAVSLDTPVSFTYSLDNENQITVVSSTELFGVDIRVERRDDA